MKFATVFGLLAVAAAAGMIVANHNLKQIARISAAEQQLEHERMGRRDAADRALVKEKELRDELREVKGERDTYAGALENCGRHTLMELEITAYTVSSDETDDDPGMTALMRKPVVGRTVAVSRDLAGLLGCEIWIEGLGMFWVEDLMNSRYTHRVDVLMGTKAEAMEWGLQRRNVSVVNQ